MRKAKYLIALFPVIAWTTIFFIPAMIAAIACETMLAGWEAGLEFADYAARWFSREAKHFGSASDSNSARRPESR